MKHFNKQKGTISRECSKCGGDLGERYGKQRYCTACHAAWSRQNRTKYGDLSPMAKKKAIARSYVKEYVKRGKVIKEPCKKCGSMNSQAHHPDYNKPLEVVWLCRKHHLELHG